MHTADPHSVRREAAGLFLLAVLLALPLVMLAWGRPGRARAAAPPPALEEPPAGLFSPEGAAWHVQLTDAGAAYLMRLLTDAASGQATQEQVEPPAECAGRSDAPVFVTVYRPGAPAMRVNAAAETLADSVREAAQAVLARSGARPPGGAFRVRLDVLLEARPLPLEQRIAFAHRVLGGPVGVAVQGGSPGVFLPADLADYRAETNVGMLQVACGDAGLAGDAWRRPEVGVWLLRAASFVTEASGSRYVLPCPRGVPPIGELTRGRLLRAGRLAGDYLLRVQTSEGWFPAFRDPAAGLQRGGCQSVSEQAAVAAALAELCELRPGPQYVTACYDAVSYLMAFTESDPSDPRMAFTRRQEVCRVVWELEASANVLEALCRYRRVSGRIEPDAWIAALAEFLLFMQADDGLFYLSYDAEAQMRGMPPTPSAGAAPHAKAALALCLAHRELGTARYLAGAQRALARLMARDAAGGPSADEARWLTLALREAHAAAPAPEYASWAASIAAGRRLAQLGPSDAPAPDLVGGELSSFPPSAEATAADLVVFASACMMDAGGAAANLEAARRAAGYLARLQFLPENSYYLSDPEAGTGGFRERPGSNMVRVGTLEAALRGLVALTRLELQGTGSSD